MSRASRRAIAAMPRSGIREVMDLARGREGVLHLEVGEPDFPTPAHIVEAAARRSRDGHTKYTAERGHGVTARGDRAKLARATGSPPSPSRSSSRTARSTRC